MYTHRTYAFFIAAFSMVSVINNKLCASDSYKPNPLLHMKSNKKEDRHDFVQFIFESGTEKSNQALRRTCKSLNAAGKRYRDNQVALFNERFEGMVSIKLKDSETGYEIPTIVISPGGKEIITTQFIKAMMSGMISRDGSQTPIIITERKMRDINPFLNKDFTDCSAGKKANCISDIHRRYYIGFAHNKGDDYIAVITASRVYGHKIKSEKPKLNGCTFSLSVDHSTTEPIADKNPEMYPDEIVFVPQGDKLLTITHTQECPLADHNISYHALHDIPACDEYELGCWLTTNELNSNISEIPLAITAQKCTKQYRLKKDSLLHDKQAQQDLYKFLSAGEKGLLQTLAISGDTVKSEELRGFYITAVLWANNTPIAYESLSALCDQEIEANRYQAKPFINRALDTIIPKINYFASPFRKIILDKETVENWNGELSGNLKQMKDIRKEKSYRKYLDEVKRFVSHECKEWELGSKKQ